PAAAWDRRRTGVLRTWGAGAATCGSLNDALIRRRSWLAVGIRCCTAPWSHSFSRGFSAADAGPPIPVLISRGSVAATAAPARNSRRVAITSSLAPLSRAGRNTALNGAARQDLCDAPCQSGSIAGIHRQHGAGDVAAAVAEEIFDHARDIICLRQALQRAAAGDLLLALAAKALGQFRVDEARRDRIHGNAELADLARQRAGEAGGCCFGGA